MPNSDPQMDEDYDIQLEFNRKMRENVYAQLQKVYDASSKVAPGCVSNFLARCNELDKLRAKFDLLQDNILKQNLYVEKDKIVEIDKVQASFDDLYFNIRTVEQDLKARMITNVVPPPTPSKVDVRLPKLDIPTWSGDLGQFQNFFAMFNTLVHEGDYPGVVKLAYLRKSLQGPPLSLIQNLELNDVNYTIAYNLIQQRYEDPRSLASFYVNKMLDFRSLTSTSLKDLQLFLDVFGTTAEAFKKLKLEDHGDFFMFQCALRSLPSSFRTLFERSVSHIDIPSFEHLTSFVENQCKIEELTRRSSTNPPSTSTKTSNSTKAPPKDYVRNPQSLLVTPDKGDSPSPTPLSPTTPQVNTQTSGSLCPFCNERPRSHHPHSCPKYEPLSLNDKYAIVKKLYRCFKCLGSHSRSVCKSQGRCIHCSSPAHHSSLHDPTKSGASLSTQAGQAATSSLSSSSSPAQSLTTTTTSSRTHVFTGTSALPSARTVLLGTAQALIRDKKGRMQPVRIVIDGGSQVCLISSECSQRLGLQVTRKHTQISGALTQDCGSSSGVISCAITPRHTRTPVLVAEAVVVQKVCVDLPTVSLPQEVYERFATLNLADRAFHQRGPIDFLLGASLFPLIFGRDNQVKQGEPAAISTIFGYVIMGNVSYKSPQAPSCDVSLMTCDVDLDQTLQRFWQTEDENFPSRHLDPEHLKVETHFVSTHSRRPDGSYVVRLPFKHSVEDISFHDMEIIARRRWISLESRLRKNENLRVAYHSFMEEYLRLGHMKPATGPGAYYIPHFGIVKDSPTSPIRVVFDASCKDSNTASLNEYLHVGPPLQKDICVILTLARLYPVALSSDIKMMYRKIWIHPDDAKFQHIFWRRWEHEHLIPYELQTVTYGTTSAPFLAQRTLVQLVDDEGHKFPLASKVVLESCYVDDIVTSVPTVEEAVQLKMELVELLGLGGFDLRKWASNSASVLHDIPEEHRVPSLSLKPSDSASLHILGIKWEPASDIFTYNVKLLSEGRTKRQVLSQIASLFDPLGWVSPVVFRAKLFMKEIWERKLDWDDVVPEDIRTRWAEFSSQLSSLSSIRFSRLLLHPNWSKVELIGFCDASCQGYAACIYLRSSSEDGQVFVSLLKAKTRVAPLKVLTVPRLELCGAFLLSKLVESAQFLISKLNITDIHLFTDSTVVLGWLHTPPHRLQTFVANRVVSILEITKVNQWHHVGTNHNVADAASRGLYPLDIVDHASWWAGPSYLRLPFEEWPIDQLTPASDLPEVKQQKQALLATPRVKTKRTPLFISLIEKHSSLNRLKRVVAWMLRLIHNSRQHGPRAHLARKSGPLLPDELASGMTVCVKATQHRYFPAELRAVQKGRHVAPHIARLTPFLQNGVLRVGGRLSRSLLPYDAKHPVLLPKEAHLSKLICSSFHRSLLHAGPQACQAAICQEYWILSLRSVLRQSIMRCMVCYRHKIKEKHPLMADLPPSRITPCRPFNRTSVDFAGPILLKQSSRRNAAPVKAYICIFVCHVTKAVHIELVGSLSTDSFTAALSRFISRRGLCQDIYCDNATNFTGASNEGKVIFEFLSSSSEQVCDYLTNRQITYHFNTPEAPWTGGLHEAAVKSAKRHLRCLSDRLLTYEEMSTVLTRIEAVLNSRPLCPLSDSPESEFLSPGHFLVGGPLLSPLEYDLTQEPENHLSRWQLVQQALQIFWNRWSANYLHTLMERQKWTTPQPPLKIGDVVIMLRNKSRPMDWPLGRITELQPGADGIARSATVKTAHGSFKRPVAKLAPLPLQDSQ